VSDAKSDHKHDLSVVTFLYRNHRGEVAWRRIIPIRIWFGCTAWHREAQWLLEAVDLDKQSKRDFDTSSILTPWLRLADVPTVELRSDILANHVLSMYNDRKGT
jgi:hypothetical protein